MLKRTAIYLILNFAALGLGSVFTSEGVISEWYADLDKAPWTPPGWFFGFAWTTIMIAFALYMAHAWSKVVNKRGLLILYGIQWILNISWNPIFFYYHQVALGLISITLLTLVVGIFLVRYKNQLGVHALWVTPYFVWLLVATSLNAYILIQN
ncbi:TspO/MBR family protein [Reichenbachiella ulvae]|uniref:Tryptophan-rich sensory protein n=1 Tax=Reichenbachiella ulvae TaxID=2980104 RepID=A0ABT3CZ09_9BACT|nr:TspO/MBR family protein [Reichenbachiella ulvae]MCV9388794.1 tryptophan-rich sensory protein [Reichenbachiella ulvae]